MHGIEVEENIIFQQAKKKASHLKNCMNYFNLTSKRSMAVASERLPFLKNNSRPGEWERIGIGEKDYFKISEI